MKKISLIIRLLLPLMLASCASSRLTKEEQTALREAIETRHYKIDVSYMLPTNGAARYLNSSYSLEIDGDNIISYLPYFGRAYSIPYGGGKGLNFKSKIDDYKVESSDSSKTVTILQTHTEEDRYQYVIEIYSSGKASISVTSNQRQQIAFQGEVVVLCTRRGT